MTHPSEDYAHTAELLRKYMNDRSPDNFRAICSNNLNIILAALDLAAGRTAERERKQAEWDEMLADGVCPACSGDCGSANPPVLSCPMRERTP
jgi:hypothetical protein